MQCGHMVQLSRRFHNRPIGSSETFYPRYFLTYRATIFRRVCENDRAIRRRQTDRLLRQKTKDMLLCRMSKFLLAVFGSLWLETIVVPWTGGRAVVQGLICLECTTNESVEFCNLTANSKACEGQEVCILQYRRMNNRTMSLKGCLRYTDCEEKNRQNGLNCLQGDPSRDSPCTWCCSVDYCNYDNIAPRTTNSHGAMTPTENNSDEELGQGVTTEPRDNVTCLRSQQECLTQFREGVLSAIRSNGTGFSDFCRNIPEVFSCVATTIRSCDDRGGGGVSAAGGLPVEELQSLWERLRLVCPSACNRSAALTCVFDAFDDVISAFTTRSNACCEDLMRRVKVGYDCIALSSGSCEDRGQTMAANDRVLEDIESIIGEICPRLPSSDLADNPPQQIKRVGLAPCQLEEAMHCISQTGSAIIRDRVEEQEQEGFSGSGLMESCKSCVRSRSDSCVLVRRKRAILATRLVERLHGPVRKPQSKCNTTSARTCIVELMEMSTKQDIEDSCKFVEQTKSCVAMETESCTMVERESLNSTLSTVLQLVMQRCAPYYQCLSKETITLTEGGTSGSIRVKLTSLPASICDIPGCEIFLDIIPQNDFPPKCRNRSPIAQFQVSSDSPPTANANLCSRPITKDNWKEVHEFQLAAKVDFKLDNTQPRKVKVVLRKVVNGKLRERRTICEHQVVVFDGDRNKVCQSVTDPHILTFDGRAYNVFLDGFFTLYRHRTLPYEVQVAFQRCVQGGATCNCAVAVKAGDSVFVVDKCRRRAARDVSANMAAGPCERPFNRIECLDYARTEIFYNDKITPGLRVFNRGDAAIEVLLPHGTRVVIRGRRWYNVYIYPSPFDWNSTQGLCGTYDGQSRNDLTLRNGRLWRESLSHRGEPPLDFSLDWRVPSGQLLFNGVARSPFRLPVQCDCDIGSEADGSPRRLCHFSRNLELCDFNTEEEKTFKLPKGQPRSEKDYLPDFDDLTHLKRKKREQEAAEHGRERRSFDFDLDPDAHVSMVGNWTKPAAFSFCFDRLVNGSAAVSACRPLLDAADVDFAVDSCVEDILLSGDTMLVTGALETLKSRCLEQVSSNVSLHNTEDGGDICLEVEETLCLEECEPHGHCFRGRCYCEDGYVGSACSVLAGAAPQLIVLPDGGLCDRRRAKCDQVLVLGETFIDTTNLTCRRQQVTLDSDNSTAASSNSAAAASEGINSTVLSAAVFITSQQVLCPTGVSSADDTFLISVSNDGANFSWPRLFLSRDMACYDCSLDAPGHTVCHRKPGTCLVRNRCYKSGEEDASDPCVVCDPRKSISELHRSTDAKCADRVFVTVVVVILAVILCALMIALVVRLKRHSTRSDKSKPRGQQTTAKFKADETRSAEGTTPESPKGRVNFALDTIDEEQQPPQDKHKQLN